MSDNVGLNVSEQIPYGFRYPYLPDGTLVFSHKLDLDSEVFYNENYNNHGLLKLLRHAYASIDDNADFLSEVFDINSLGKFERSTKEKAHGEHSMLRWCYELVQNEIQGLVPGEVFEFGCFTGISTAKITIASSFAGKKLYVFDSFEGLPSPEDYGAGDQKSYYAAGEYSTPMDVVSFNVSTHGLARDTTFIKGFFENSIPRFENDFPDMKVSYAFIDVDLAKSIEECLDYVVPRLSVGGMIFMDEFADKDNFEIFKKFGLYDQEKFETRSVSNRSGGILKNVSPDKHYNCGIIKKIS